MQRIITLGLIILLHSTFASAQNDDEDAGLRSSFSPHVGVLLPNQIEGVTEIMPMWGARYAFPYRGKNLVEVGYANSKAEGSEIHEASVSFRGDFPIEDLMMLAYLGANIWHYNPVDEPFVTDFGAYAGGGFFANITDVLKFRTEMKFNLNPGTSLYIGFGFEFKLGASEEDEDE